MRDDTALKQQLEEITPPQVKKAEVGTKELTYCTSILTIMDNRTE